MASEDRGTPQRLIATSAVLTALIVALVQVPLGPARAAGARNARALDAGVLARINVIRVAHGLGRLRPSATLSTAAAGHSAEMLADGYFGHASADGSPFWVRLSGFTHGSLRASVVGENLLWASPDLSADGAVSAWMASPEHRANLLAPGWRVIGVAAVHADAARGVFGNGALTVITADFGSHR